jgi:hypothetical protein
MARRAGPLSSIRDLLTRSSDKSPDALGRPRNDFSRIQFSGRGNAHCDLAACLIVRFFKETLLIPTILIGHVARPPRKPEISTCPYPVGSFMSLFSAAF